MTEPIPMFLARLERQLGLVAPGAARGDRDCPDPELLAWLDALDPLYDLLEPIPGDGTVAAQVAARIEQRRFERLKRRLALWRGAALVTGSAAAVLAALMLAPLAAPPPAPTPTLVQQEPLTAIMQPIREDAAPLFVLVAGASGATIQSTPANADAAPGHFYHLWIVDGTLIAKIGTISPTQSHSVVVPDQLRARLSNGAGLVVTLDPAAADVLARDRIVARGSLATI